MQLKYNRQQSIGNTIFRISIKIVLLVLIVVVGIFLIEKIKFPSPKKNITMDITNEIEKLK